MRSPNVSPDRLSNPLCMQPQSISLNANSGRRKSSPRRPCSLDEPTTFTFNNQIYEPANYHDDYHGTVTVRQALAKSMNIPTIKAAEQIGYEKVANVVRAAGVRSPVMGTPSLALGSYEVTPIELAESYTMFANNGVHVQAQLCHEHSRPHKPCGLHASAARKPGAGSAGCVHHD